MRLLITGGTGFIGTPLCRTLAQHGHELSVLTRRSSPSPPMDRIRFLSLQANEWEPVMAEVDGVVNLAGEPIAGKRWTARQKALMRESRLQMTRRVVRAIDTSRHRPAVLVSASAIGYYGPRGDEALSEDAPPGRGFLAELSQAWEAEARAAERFGVRVVRLRIGIVLGAAGGALAKMVPPFRIFLGGPLGSGRQWMSWIHLGDLIGLIEWSLTHPELSGAVNATSPHPVTMRELCTALARALRRPSWAPVPGFALRLLLGEMADVLLTGQRVIPTAAHRSGFTFRFPELAPALDACLPVRGGRRA